ncbi:MAG: hypothetical protein AAF447_20455 [Myxococcota bacterium]
MGDDATLFLVSLSLGWAALMTHGVALWQALLGPEAPRWKLAALVPPVTPYVCWRGGKRLTAAAWVVLFAAWAVAFSRL